jgi:hypothetical protein
MGLDDRIPPALTSKNNDIKNRVHDFKLAEELLYGEKGKNKLIQNKNQNDSV